MKPKKSIKLITAVILLTMTLSCGKKKNEQNIVPNVLIINIDDMGYGDMSCHGNPAFNTPALDKLYCQSARFSEFHVAPMCTPTRGQLMTGRDALKNGARWVGTENTHLRTDFPIMAEVFKNAGYSTGIFGKWHLGDNYPLRPQDRGFDEVVSFPQQEVGTVNDFWTNDYFDDTYLHNGEQEKYEGFCTDVWFGQAKNWIEKKREAKEPFFCYIPTNVTHGPYFVEQKYRDMVENQQLSIHLKTFVGTMINLDENIGKLLNYLDETRLSESTIVVFMTDNGATMGYGLHNAGMRGTKTQLWEGGHRVPLFIRLPQASSSFKGKDIKGLAQVQDIFPTLLDLCDIQPEQKIEFDGISLEQQIKGKELMPDRILVNQFQRRLEIKKYDACIMWGPWRLLNAIDADPKETEHKKAIYEVRKKNYEINLELYNIENDPHQDNNVIDQHPNIVKKMKAYYENWWESTRKGRETFTPVVIGNNAENPVELAATSWAETYFTQKSQILLGQKKNGWWNLHVETDGEYEIKLRRWPKETNTPLSGIVGVTYTDSIPYGPGQKGVALPIASAKIKIGKIEKQIKVAPDDLAAVFQVKLEKGPIKLQTWFYDKNGKELCGAYYADVNRK
uniref:arylsulfatase n=1 Tax=uncultured Draconibacterium sp. TaxID=1573823 RepID=UPI0032165A72